MKVGALSYHQLYQQLAGPGLRLRTGPFIAHVRSVLPAVAEGIALLYGEYPLEADDGFADFHMNLHTGRGLRRWIRPQARFDLDGMAPFKPLPAAHGFSLFEWALNWCVSSRAHHYLIIHAAVVEKNGRAAILPAPSGSGKSTLCAALVCRGWRLLSDELALVSVRTGLLVPMPRPVSLKNASIDLIRSFADGAVFSRPSIDTVKGTIAHLKAPSDSVRRAADAAAPGWVVFPRYQKGAASRLEPVSPMAAFPRLAENAFNYSQLGADGFTTLCGLVDRVESYDFSYSRLDDGVAMFDRLASGPA